MSKENVIAIACADLHLSHTPPTARASEPDWYKLQGWYLNQLRELRDKYNVPIICAGDVFNVWNPPPELINFALDAMPSMYAVPGQHDLPNHEYDQMHRSAFGTMVKAKRINLVPPEGAPLGDGVRVFGFGWGQKLSVPSRAKGVNRTIALVHDYYADCEENAHVSADKNSILPIHNPFPGFDTVIIGDNHVSWDRNYDVAGTYVFNCGSFLRLTTAQVKHRPRIGLVLESGEVESHYLVNLDKKMITKHSEEYSQQVFDDFIREVSMLDSNEIDFRDTIRIAMKKAGLSKGAKQLLAEVING